VPQQLKSAGISMREFIKAQIELGESRPAN